MRIVTLVATVAVIVGGMPAMAQTEPTAPFNTPVNVGGWTLTPGNTGCTISAISAAKLEPSGTIADTKITVTPRSDGRYDLNIYVSRVRMPQTGSRYMLMIGEPPIPLSGRTASGPQGQGGGFDATLDANRIAFFDASKPVEIRNAGGTPSQGLFITLGMPALGSAMRTLPLCQPGPNLKASPRYAPERILREGDLDAVSGASKAGLFEGQLTYDNAGKP